MRRSLALLLLAVLAASCGDSTSATFAVGVGVELDAADLALPSELRDGDSIASLPCGPMGMCPTSAEVPVTCEADLCDPAPQTLTFDVGDVDIDEEAGDVSDLFSSIDTIEILEIDYLVETNTLTLPTSDIEIFWGPAAAVDVGSPGVTRLGTLPALAAMETGEGGVILDEAGRAAFTEYFETTSHRFRFFVRTPVDLEPGQAWPAGGVAVLVRMRVRVSGSIL